MRLIDADALLDRIPEGDIEHDDKISRCGAITDMIMLISGAPTVDAVPVRRAYWNHLTDYDEEWGLMEYCMCSNCEGVEFGKSSYCPFCGARMDGDSHE